VRTGIRLLINAESDMVVVGEGTDGSEAMRLVDETKPDVLILDLAMPKQNGLQTIASIRKAFPQLRILVFTMHDDAAYLRSVLAMEGTGYVLKTAEDRELLTAVRTVASGRVYVNASLRSNLHEAIASRKSGQARGSLESLAQLLGEREREVLQLVAAGYTNQEIGDRINLSVKSVETYRARLMEKLGLHSRAELVRYALDCGLLGSVEPGMSRH
jgi:two-component system, NarL family, response regulator NreC